MVNTHSLQPEDHKYKRRGTGWWLERRNLKPQAGNAAVRLQTVTLLRCYTVTLLRMLSLLDE